MRDSLAWGVGVLVLAAALGMEITVSPVLAETKPEWTSPCRFCADSCKGPYGLQSRFAGPVTLPSASEAKQLCHQATAVWERIAETCCAGFH